MCVGYVACSIQMRLHSATAAGNSSIPMLMIPLSSDQPVVGYILFLASSICVRSSTGSNSRSIQLSNWTTVLRSLLLWWPRFPTVAGHCSGSPLRTFFFALVAITFSLTADKRSSLSLWMSSSKESKCPCKCWFHREIFDSHKPTNGALCCIFESVIQ